MQAIVSNIDLFGFTFGDGSSICMRQGTGVAVPTVLPIIRGLNRAARDLVDKLLTARAAQLDVHITGLLELRRDIIIDHMIEEEQEVLYIVEGLWLQPDEVIKESFVRQCDLALQPDALDYAFDWWVLPMICVLDDGELVWPAGAVEQRSSLIFNVLAGPIFTRAGERGAFTWRGLLRVYAWAAAGAPKVVGVPAASAE